MTGREQHQRGARPRTARVVAVAGSGLVVGIVLRHELWPVYGPLVVLAAFLVVSIADAISGRRSQLVTCRSRSTGVQASAGSGHPGDGGGER